MTVTIPIIAADGTQSIVTLPRATAFLPKYGGGLCYAWERVIGNVWISVEDPSIDGGPDLALRPGQPGAEGIDPAAARRLAESVRAPIFGPS
jgi:hypothetical protein